MLANLALLSAAKIHLYIFVLESLLWSRPKTNRIFGVSAEQAAQMKDMAFNQGFYNLFLCVAVAGGMYAHLYWPERAAQGEGIMLFGAFSMVLASLVLLYTDRKMIRAVLIQGLMPAIGLILYFVG